MDSDQTKVCLHRHLRRHYISSVIVDSICVSTYTLDLQTARRMRSMGASQGSPCRAVLPILQPLLHAFLPEAAGRRTRATTLLADWGMKFLEVLLLRSMASLESPVSQSEATTPTRRQLVDTSLTRFCAVSRWRGSPRDTPFFYWTPHAFHVVKRQPPGCVEPGCSYAGRRPALLRQSRLWRVVYRTGPLTHQSSSLKQTATCHSVGEEQGRAESARHLTNWLNSYLCEELSIKGIAVLD